jgi:hypothetical protein
MLRALWPLLLCVSLFPVQARVLKLRIERREPVLNAKPFAPAGAYEKLTGKIDFALDPTLTQNSGIIDLALAPRNSRGEVEFSADFYLLKPIDPARGNGRLLYEVGNRGGKSLLRTFQKATTPADDPKTESDFGDGLLMRQGYTLLWMGWQWDVPNGKMRMDMPLATDHGAPITGLLRGNFILDQRSPTAPLADRNHRAYPIADLNSPDAFMTVRDAVATPAQRIPRNQWHFVDDNNVALDGGFEPGRIYDVVYRAKDPRVTGTDFSGTRDLISFLKHATDGNPIPTLKYAYGWGVSQSGRFLRDFLYQGFNEDEQGRIVFDGVIDEVGGAGRGSFNHRFAQASRDAEQFFNFLYPVDMFPFTDSEETDPQTHQTGSLLARAEARHVAPKLFHILSNSEYFNRAGSLVHTDPTGTHDIAPPASSRIYTIASGPHFFGPFPPSHAPNLAAALSPLNRGPIVRALLAAMDAWVTENELPPPSQVPQIKDGTLTPPEKAGWPRIPGVLFPPPTLIAYRLDFGPKWQQGIVDFEPPHIGKPYPTLVPAVDKDGIAIAGIHLPAVSVPIATYTGWNYRAKGTGAEAQFNGEAGSIFPFPKTRKERESTGDSRLSIEERYQSRDEYIGKVAQAALTLVNQRYLLPQDVPDMIDFAAKQYDWSLNASAAAPSQAAAGTAQAPTSPANTKSIR